MNQIKKWLLRPSFVLLLCMFGASMAYCYWPNRSSSLDRQRLLKRIPVVMADWRMTEEIELTRLEKQSLGADDYLLRFYDRGQDQVMLYIAFFTSKHGSITHNPEKCYPGHGFHVTRRKIVECPKQSWGSFPAIRVVPIRDEEKVLVLYWFQEGENVIVDKWKHVMKVLTGTLVYNRTESFMVRVSMPFESDQDMPGKTEILTEFADLIRAEICVALEETEE